MSFARRGEIWQCDFGDPAGREQGLRRPALIVSDDRLNAGPGGVVVVIPLTTRHRGLPMHVEIDSGESGLAHASYARCEDVHSVSDQRLIAKLGSAPPAAMFQSAQILRWLLALD